MNQQPTLFVVFGATGDLFKRKLFPAFENLCEYSKCNYSILGVGRQHFNDESFREYINEQINLLKLSKESSQKSFSMENLLYSQLNFTTPQGYSHLKERIDKLVQSLKSNNVPNNISKNTKLKEIRPQIIFYLAVSPQLFYPILENINNFNIENQDYADTKIVFEKPFGFDLNSARELNKAIQNVFNESQIYRIDHYLGKEGVQNFMALRFANSLFEPIWNNHYIDNIQINAFEQLGIGSRAEYYEHSGALRDMVQNHILQMLSYIAMEPPVTLDAKHIRDEKVKVFSSIVKDEKLLKKNSVFGQYTSGEIEGKKVVSYKDEKGVNPQSQRETFVALKLEIDNWRWSGVPFYIRTGKRMLTKETTIIIEFKKIPTLLYNKDNSLSSNKLVIKVQPDTSINLHFNVKGEDTLKTKNPIIPITSEFNHYKCFTNSYKAYEVLLKDIINSDQSLFTRWDGVEASWKILDKLVNCKNNCTIIHPYPSGSFGPKAAEELINKDKRNWN